MLRCSGWLAGSCSASCAERAPGRRPPDARGASPACELAAFEIRDDQVDRFEHCPPAGEIGQDWLPPPARVASARGHRVGRRPRERRRLGRASTDAVRAGGRARSSRRPTASLADARSTRRRTRRTLPSAAATTAACSSTRPRTGTSPSCCASDRSGKVAQVETWGACDLAPETLVCMRDEASAPRAAAARRRLGDRHRSRSCSRAAASAAEVAERRLRRRGVRRRRGDAPAACTTARRRPSAQASPSSPPGTMKIDVDAQGHGVHVSVDPWAGGQRGPRVRGRGAPWRQISLASERARSGRRAAGVQPAAGHQVKREGRPSRKRRQERRWGGELSTLPPRRLGGPALTSRRASSARPRAPLPGGGRPARRPPGARRSSLAPEGSVASAPGRDSAAQGATFPVRSASAGPRRGRRRLAPRLRRVPGRLQRRRGLGDRKLRRRHLTEVRLEEVPGQLYRALQHGLHRRREVGRAREAILGALGERAVHDLLEQRRERLARARAG